MNTTPTTQELATLLNITHKDLDIETIDYIVSENKPEFDRMHATPETRVLYAARQMGWK